jgi:aspartokinase-like uncharacterized kinase
MPRVVVKIGGSLLDLPDLGARLRTLLDTLPAETVLVPGGGPAADLVRDWDRRHEIGEEAAHWLALRACSLNAWLLAELLRPCHTLVTGRISRLRALWREGALPVLDPYRFALGDERQPGRLPQCWEATGDSLAARLAVRIRAGEVLLLKSADPPPGAGLGECGRQGFVDPYFKRALASGGTRGAGPPGVRFMNLRRWQPT